MALIDVLIGPIASIIDKIIPDKEAQAKATLELLTLQGSQEMQMLETQLQAIVAEANSADPWTSRARPNFLYVMYILLRISKVLDTHFAKSRTSVSLSPGQLAQIGQECLFEFQAAMISAFSPWVKRDGARVLRMLSPSRAMR